jgi:hypothetical protein
MIFSDDPTLTGGPFRAPHAQPLLPESLGVGRWMIF